MKPSFITKILVPIDFSDISVASLETAGSMAKRQQASIIILHVVKPVFLPSLSEGHQVAMGVLNEMKTAALHNLQTAAKELTNKTGVEVMTDCTIGNVIESIVSTATTQHCDLIIMGTHGTSGFREFFTGSNCYAVIKNSFCPVLTVPGVKEKKTFSKILFPVRLIPNALEKFELVREVVKKNDAQLHVLGLISSTENEEQHNMLQQQIQIFLKSLDDEGIKTTAVISIADNLASETLCEANKIEADMIVTTANLDYTIHNFFNGPFVKQIVNHAKIPVLSVKPGPTKPAIAGSEYIPGSRPWEIIAHLTPAF